MRDFTLKIYKKLLAALMTKGHQCVTFQDFMEGQNQGKVVILRHDIDRKPQNALYIAGIERKMGVKGSYYFRMVRQSYHPEIIAQLASMGHEVGYHYENLSTVAGRSKKLEDRREKIEGRREKGERRESRSTKKRINQSTSMLYEMAIEDFEENLERLRQLVPIKTICMHGSPLSRYDNRELWHHYHYRDYGIIGEPYFDLDFNRVLYLTDTGRRWDGEAVSVRDKVFKQEIEDRREKLEDRREKLEDRREKLEDRREKLEVRREKGEERREKAKGKWQEVKGPSISQPLRLPTSHLHSTFDIIKALEKEELPDQIMINTHPQRWTDNIFLWIREFSLQHFKNVIKKYFYAKRRQTGL